MALKNTYRIYLWDGTTETEPKVTDQTETLWQYVRHHDANKVATAEDVGRWLVDAFNYGESILHHDGKPVQTQNGSTLGARLAAN